MSPERIIPITPIMRRYQRLRTAAQRDRLSEARRVLEHPEELAAEFATSVRHFAAYRNVNEHFYDAAAAKRRAQHRPGEMLKRTNDLVLRLEKLKPGDGIHPVDSDSRVPAVMGDSLVDVPAADLAFEYADRELLTQRTTSPARWEDGTPNRGGVRLDVLLANLDDRTPIAAEVKIARDMDPFFALVQALACAAHLGTPNQYERLRRHVFRGRFREPTDAPQLDVYVLFVDSSTHGAYMGHLTAAAPEVAKRLLRFEAVTQSVRRIAGLDIELHDAGSLASRVRWAWEPAPAAPG
jgi:hypothetical protein